MINFNEPYLTGSEEKYILQFIKSHKISGDEVFTCKCHDIYCFHFSLCSTG